MSDNRRNATLKALIDAAITELMIKTSGEQIYLDDNTTLSSKMAEMVTAINLRDKKTDVDAKIKTVTDSLNSTSESLGNDISTLRSEKADKTEVTEKIKALKQEIMGDLPVEAYDTFTELAAYIEEHQEAADALTAAIGNKADKTVVDDILTVINGLGALANKDKVAKDDLDASLKTELDAKATTEAMNTALATKSDTNHTHDNRYYTKAETDTAIANAPKGDTGVWISQADYDALSDEDKALDLNYYIYDAKSNSGSDSGSSGISISQAEYDALSAEEKASEVTYYIYDANSNPNAASIPFTSENYTATNVGAALEEVNGKLNNIKSEWIYLYGNDSSECYLKYKIEGTTCYVDAFIPITITTTSGWSLSSVLSAPLPKSKRTNAMAANFPAQCYYPNICVFGRMTTGGAIAVFANNSAFSLQTYNFAFNFTYEIYTSTAPIADVNL